MVEEREMVFEGRREEVVGFLGKCEELGLDLERQLQGNQEKSSRDVAGLGKSLAELKV